ncbi:hybrid sensor histidine kinase/response regulator transcription factor [Carboxylicivirga linearis]|uniref:histidine kinase n=1 Tax=Carboxylicivirga linearis TaxID=1628157 RepID=A0ABS5JSB8_9BACT|nr:hybrid sensor histidine kinase/response regulator transcription factor [Carboxylicivirga linearis]MBS2097814.1 response regulator [Carboxylicivirga linearis]
MQQLFSEKGLPGSIVSCLYEDSFGYIWFGIEASGLYRYDGVNILHFAHQNSSNRSLTNNFVNVITEDKEGKLWVGTTGGLDLFDSTREVVQHFLTEDNEKINALIENYDGEMLVGTNTGLYSMNISDEVPNKIYLPGNEGVRVRCLKVNDKQVLIGTSDGLFIYSDEKIRQVSSTSHLDIISIDIRSEFIVLGSSKGVFLAELETGTIHQIQFNQHDLYNHGKVGIRKLFIDSQGKWWVATMQYGLICVDEKDLNHQYEFANTISVNGLQTGTITDMMEDRYHNVWVASKYDGLFIYDQRLQLFEGVSINHPDKDLFVMSVCEDDNNTLWLGTRTEGLFKITMDNKYPQPVHPDNVAEEQARRIQALFFDTQKRLWLGSETGVLITDTNLNNSEFHPIRSVWNIQADASGKIWVATSKGLFVYDEDLKQLVRFQSINHTDFFNSDIQTGLIRTTQDGSLWFGTLFNGLYRYLPMKDSLVHYTTNSDLPLSDNSIRAFYEDEKNRIWIGTRSQGLNCLDMNSDTVTYFMKQGGLASNAVYNILPDENDNIWLGTDMGLVKFNMVDYAVENYNREYGLPTSVFEPRSSLKLKNGQLAFGYYDGLVCFSPDKITKITNTSPLIVTSVLANGEEIEQNITGNNTIVLNYNQNQLSFKFALLDYAIASRNKYRYKLLGFDGDWQGPTEYTIAKYTNLSPGQYQFIIEATNYQNDWSELPVVIDVIINKPYYATVWAYLLYTLFIGTVGFISIRIIGTQLKLKRQVKQAKDELQQTIDLETAKIQFFTNVVHEFQTPLTLILAPLEKLLAKISQSPETIKYSEIIKKQMRHLEHLIGELLLYRKIQSSTGEYKPQYGNIADTVLITIQDFQELVESKSIALTYTSKLNQCEILFDEDKITKVLNNLLMNSIKYSHEGGAIHLLIQEVDTDELDENVISSTFAKRNLSDRYISISITDDGSGMSEEEVQKVFSRFYQSNGKGFGAGVGLSLAKALVELHDGFIMCESTLGKGSTFRVYLPMIIPALNSLKPKSIVGHPISTEKTHENTFNSEEADFNNSNKLSVLIIDDNEDLLFFLSENLSNKYSIQTASNGEQGLELATQYIPDLIITDVAMPLMNGFQLCSLLKQKPATCHIPIIILTKESDHDSKISGMKHGADEYIPKPFSIEYLEIRIGGLLKLRKNIQQSLLSGVLPAHSQGLSSYDQEFLQRLKSSMTLNLSEPDYGVEQLAKDVGFSRTQLHRKIKAILNQTPSEYIYGLRLTEAIRLLQEKGLTVSETAYRTGFKSPASFSTVFKNKYGYAPSQVKSDFVVKK